MKRALETVKQAIKEGDQRAVGRGVIDRAADKQTVGLHELFSRLVDDVLLNAALSLVAVIAGEAAAELFAADLHQLGFDAFGVERGDHLVKRAGRAAVNVGAAVDDQYFHMAFSFISNRYSLAYRTGKDKENLSHLPKGRGFDFDRIRQGRRRKRSPPP